eukprot:2703143-Pyramimonas_sp.AAC.1
MQARISRSSAGPAEPATSRQKARRLMSSVSIGTATCSSSVAAGGASAAGAGPPAPPAAAPCAWPAAADAAADTDRWAAASAAVLSSCLSLSK